MTDNQEIYNLSLLPLIYFAKEAGITTSEFRDKIGIDIRLLDSSNLKLHQQQYRQLIQITQEKTGLEHLGLHVGKQVKIKNMGIQGYVMASCKTAGEAIRKSYEYNRISQNIGQLNLEISEDRVVFSWRLFDSILGEIQKFIMDAF